MTELDLAVELDLCGQEINIVVASCKYPKARQGAPQDKKWSSIDSNRHVQWCNIANSPQNSPAKEKRVKLPEINNVDCIGDKSQRYKETSMPRSTSEAVANFSNSLENTPISLSKENMSEAKKVDCNDKQSQECTESSAMAPVPNNTIFCGNILINYYLVL